MITLMSATNRTELSGAHRCAASCRAVVEELGDGVPVLDRRVHEELVVQTQDDARAERGATRLAPLRPTS